VPGTDRIAVSSQSGKLRFYDAGSYALLKTLDFGAGANTDNMRYDAAARLLYVGYGDRERGAIAAVDPTTMDRREEFRVGSHPESFQLENSGSRIFVNLPDQEAMGVIDRASGNVTKWKISGNRNSHSLAFDEISHLLFTAALQPGRFAVVDSESGRLVASLPCVLGVDDLWFDPARKRIYATGAGAIDVFEQTSLDEYNRLARVPAGVGSGSTSLYMKTRTQESLFMSWPNMLPQGVRRWSCSTSMTEYKLTRRAENRWSVALRGLRFTAASPREGALWRAEGLGCEIAFSHRVPGQGSRRREARE
jgi:hypothetical protein